jgi:hypothetical protein
LKKIRLLRKQCTIKNVIKNKPVSDITTFLPMDDVRNPLLIIFL